MECYEEISNRLELGFAGFDCPGYRLPSEAEWEYAARAGSTRATYRGDLTVRGENNAPELDAIAWYAGNSGVNFEGAWDCSNWRETQFSSKFCGPHPVGTKLANRWGLFDMLGNVREWTGDTYFDYSGQAIDPSYDGVGRRRVARGGSFASSVRSVRAAHRDDQSSSRDADLGFRLVRTLP